LDGCRNIPIRPTPNADSDQTPAHRDLGHSRWEHRSSAYCRCIAAFPLGCDRDGGVLLECGVLAANGGRCPLSDLARHFTTDRADSFDIYLPNWLARHNKDIFGALLVVGELVVLRCWLRAKAASTPRPGGREPHG